MKRFIPLLTVLAIGFSIIALFSCSDNDDPREACRKTLGEPDDYEYEEYAGYEIERWAYPRTDWNIVYVFQKSTSNCGGESEWYIARQYYASYVGYELYDPPPIIEHTPVTSAPAQKQINTTAVVTINPDAIQDTQILEVKLFYRSVGDTLFERTIMSPVDSLYSGSIPANYVTEGGVEYYISATSDITNWGKCSFLPKTEGKYVTVEVPGEGNGEVTTGEPIKVVPKTAIPPQLDSSTFSGEISPVSP